MTWSIPIWFDLWLAGMAGGAFFSAFLAVRFSGTGNKQLLRLACYLGIPMALIGVLLLIVDLGQPLRFWHLLTQFNVSPMSLGTWIVMAWVGIAFVLVILWRIENRLTEEAARNLRQLTGFLSWIGAIFSVLIMTYTGVLLGTSNQPLWAGTILTPALFVTSAIATGMSILIIGVKTTNATSNGAIPTQIIGQLAKALAVVVVLQLVVLIGYVIWLSASTLVGTGEALSLLTTGVLAVPFWAGVVLLSLLLPLGLLVLNWGKEIEAKWGAVVASSACVILGGLILRAVITIGGQM